MHVTVKVNGGKLVHRPQERRATSPATTRLKCTTGEFLNHFCYDITLGVRWAVLPTPDIIIPPEGVMISVTVSKVGFMTLGTWRGSVFWVQCVL